ncbi:MULTISPECIES: metalloregulator ArsR/SmtB family transcription factor [Rhizobium]|uniref:Transcriptional regulator n=1 Tax=Rhizobium tropici TaxID=398 RepID=A0A329YLL6_RHITR|nr:MULTISPECIES: metalloregulator ArsR/SmtB family transcription factor [Rhizobium]MBB3286663.1 DNA-binding transcriptional ArsR family regulator [Rhizobium sp. BK252]MBB3401143.1 DNA-binding transcriptional ArsR family regulator [Rhizobium sp. BK289]MBB3413721.1 DNA-binding transcriptional ArsR family regulator [Rhizobium sp. BK284]MBB3481608.1 DNA-binding transcriptional ArsR family regulator [Rhizobium sp. BK347]MDK4719799.1 metalloregulator ArsR/SmtB family transcription factor [Rhizobium 
MLSSPPQGGAAEHDVEEMTDRARKASVLLKALSHETRLAILFMLAKREKTVMELEALLDLPQAVVSQHLARLRLDKLVDTRREGRLIHYAVAHSEICAVVDSLQKAFCRGER